MGSSSLGNPCHCDWQSKERHTPRYHHLPFPGGTPNSTGLVLPRPEAERDAQQQGCLQRRLEFRAARLLCVGIRGLLHALEGVLGDFAHFALPRLGQLRNGSREGGARGTRGPRRDTQRRRSPLPSSRRCV